MKLSNVEQPKWEKEFDFKFPEPNGMCYRCELDFAFCERCKKGRADIKSFIRTVESEAYERGRAKGGIEIKMKYLDVGRNDVLDELAGEVEKMYTTERSREPIGGMCLEFADGHDNAVAEILSLINSKRR